MSTLSKVAHRLEDPEYRRAFANAQIDIGIPFQIRALMLSRGWTQEQLAAKAGMLQPRVSALMKPGKAKPNIDTLRRLAAAFDCGLLIQFIPFSTLLRNSEEFDPEVFDVASFSQDTELHRIQTDRAHVTYMPLRSRNSASSLNGQVLELEAEIHRAQEPVRNVLKQIVRDPQNLEKQAYRPVSSDIDELSSYGFGRALESSWGSLGPVLMRDRFGPQRARELAPVISIDSSPKTAGRHRRSERFEGRGRRRKRSA